MKTIATFGIGFLLGLLTAYFLIPKPGASEKLKAQQEIAKQMADTIPQVQPREDGRQYFTIQMKNKEVELYVGMPKDEVRKVLGKPKNTRVMNIAGRIHETWTYRYNYTQVEFINGYLDSVSQL